MYLTTKNKEECVGCTACANICPVKAINMQIDEEGFEYPMIDENKCISCELCIKTCELVNKKDNIKNSEIFAYALKHKDNYVRKESTSGGAFVAISDYFLENNGIIYGAAIDKDLNVIHKRASCKEEREILKKSKYVQSSLRDIFGSVEQDLKNDKMVLFTGTPCQIDGLHKYLDNKDIKNLYTCDLICHGVPSPKVYRDYINYISKNGKKSIVDFNFRDKRYGWQSHYETFKINKKFFVNNEYRKLFYSDNILRPSCYNCNYSNLNRVGDLTIGDCWGIENIDKDFIDEDGVSLVLTNTEKGKEIFDKIKCETTYKDVNVNKVLQNNLVRPTSKPETREEFWNDYKNNKFNKILKKYAPKSPERVTNKYYYIFNKIKNIILKNKGA